MSLRAEPFTASVQLVAPADASNDTEVAGLAFSGYTSVAVYNGGDNTGPLVMFLSAPGTLPLNEPIICNHGVFVECTGAGPGRGTVWM